MQIIPEVILQYFENFLSKFQLIREFNGLFNTKTDNLKKGSKIRYEVAFQVLICYTINNLKRMCFLKTKCNTTVQLISHNFIPNTK